MKESKGLGDIRGEKKKSSSVSRDLINSPCSLTFSPTVHFSFSAKERVRERLAAEREIQTLINKSFSFPNYETTEMEASML